MESKDVIEASAEQLSFPNVSIDNREGSEEVSPQCLSLGETASDSLRTPPQHSMEQQTQATNDNLSPAPPQPSLPPPVVLTVTETTRAVPEESTLTDALLSPTEKSTALVNSVHLKSCVDALIHNVAPVADESKEQQVLPILNSVQNERLQLASSLDSQLQLSSTLPVVAAAAKLSQSSSTNCSSNLIPATSQGGLDIALPLGNPSELSGSLSVAKPNVAVAGGGAAVLYEQVPSIKHNDIHSAKGIAAVKSNNPSYVKPFDEVSHMPCISDLPQAPGDAMSHQMEKETPLSLIKEEKLMNLNSNTTSTELSGMPFMKQPHFSHMDYGVKPSATPTTPTATNTYTPLPSHSYGTHPWRRSPLEAPLSLSTKSTVITSNTASLPHPSHRGIVRGLVPSSPHPYAAPPHHHQYPEPFIAPRTLPTSVPVSVVTSVSEHLQRELLRMKQNSTGPPAHNSLDHTSSAPRDSKPTVSQQGTATSVVVSSTSSISSPAVVKLPMAPLLSGNPAKPFLCGVCGKHLASKNVFHLHLRSHSGEKPFACSLCGNAFSQKTSLTRHMRSHTGERPFPCEVCNKRFADKERIKIHMRTHTGEKPFSCDICGKQFSQKSTVKRHMSVHTGEKPFRCEHCGKGFANRGNLTAHNKTHINSN